MTERRDYDALAQDINLEDITSCKRNADFLRILRDGDPDWNKQLFIESKEDEVADPDEDFLVGEGDDMGWLGYFIGRSQVLQELYIYYLPEGGEDDFYEGMSQNRSIEELEIHHMIPDDSWISLGSFLENNHNLSHLEFQGIVIRHEDAQNLASALGRMDHNSLKRLSMEGNEVGDQGFAEIAATLRSQSQLKNLHLYSNNIGGDGCIALGNTLSRWPSSNKLETLNIDYNAIDDEGLQALVSGLMNCCSLKQLDLGRNESITAAGLRSLFPLLQSESHSLETLDLYGTNFGDDGAMVLAEGMRGNRFLKELIFDFETAGMTSVGWSAFSTLLCDTSTINNTHRSNHTLTKIGDYRNEGTPQYILDYLALNKSKLTDALICKSKILRSHPDLDMGPFFEWKMKFLPVAISWLQRAHSSRLGKESNKKYTSRKLSALYKFIRAIPDLTVTGYWEGRVIDIEAKKRKLADEKRMLDDEEAVAWERLGNRPLDDANKRKRIRHG
jgi:hypothetical protein